MKQWKIIQDYPDYMACTDGTIKTMSNNKTRKERILKPLISARGYVRVSLWKNKKGNFVLIHRLIAKTFIPNPENKPQVNHINGIKTDNRVENLEWCTMEENMAHSAKTGLSAKGQRSGRSKLTDNQVLYIYDCMKIGVPIKILADKFKVSYSTISSIRTGTQWKHIIQEPINTHRGMVVTLEEVLYIEKLLETSSIYNVHKNTGYSKDLIRGIKNKKYDELKEKLQEVQSYMLE